MRVRGAFVQGLVDRLPDSQSFFSEFCLLFRCKILCGTSSDQWALGQASLLIEKIENDKKIRFFYHLNYCCCAVLVIMKQISILAQYDTKLL